jgi:hypothetical protein
MDAREAALRVEGATDQHELLFALVAWWQRLRHSRIATLVDVLSRRLGIDRGPLDTKRRAHAEWMATVKLRDPVDVPRLVEAMWHASAEQAYARLGALVERDDPQVGPALLALLERDCSRWRNARSLWDRVVAAVIDARDVRMHEAIETALQHVGGALRSRTGDRLHGELEAARSRIPREEPTLDAQADRLIANLERELAVAPRPRKATLDELLQLIYAEPDDDGPREVYADAIGGAIGELIIAQLRSTEPPPDITRDRPASGQPTGELLDAIIGPLRGLANHALIVRGFAEQVSLWSRPTAVRRHVGLPAWSLVTHLSLHTGPDDRTRAVHLLGHDVMSRVHAIGGLDPTLLEHLAGRPVLARLESLVLALGADGPGDTHVHLASLAKLRRLGFESWHHAPPPWLERLDGAARLDELAVRTNQIAAWIPALRALGTRAVTIEVFSSGAIRYTGDRLVIDVGWRGTDMLRILGAAADVLLPGVASIVLTGKTEERQDLRDGLTGLVHRAGLRVTIDG